MEMEGFLHGQLRAAQASMGYIMYINRRRDGPVVSALDSGASGLGSSPGQGNCVLG